MCVNIFRGPHIKVDLIARKGGEIRSKKDKGAVVKRREEKEEEKRTRWRKRVYQDNKNQSWPSTEKL